MNGIDLANFFSCIPGAKVIEEAEAYPPLLECTQKPYITSSFRSGDINTREGALIELAGKQYYAYRFFAEGCYVCPYLRICRDSYGDAKTLSTKRQSCFVFLNAENKRQRLALSFVWDYSHVKWYKDKSGRLESFIEGVMIATCDDVVWKTENFRLYCNDDYGFDDGAVLLNDVRSVLKDKVLIGLYDKFLPPAEIKPRKEIDFSPKHRRCRLKTFFCKLFLWCGGWIFIVLKELYKFIRYGFEECCEYYQDRKEKFLEKRESRRKWLSF